MEPQSSDELFEEMKLEENEKLGEEYHIAEAYNKLQESLGSPNRIDIVELKRKTKVEEDDRNVAEIMIDDDMEASYENHMEEDYTTTIPNDPLA